MRELCCRARAEQPHLVVTRPCPDGRVIGVLRAVGIIVVVVCIAVGVRVLPRGCPLTTYGRQVVAFVAPSSRLCGRESKPVTTTFSLGYVPRQRLVVVICVCIERRGESPRGPEDV